MLCVYYFSGAVYCVYTVYILVYILVYSIHTFLLFEGTVCCSALLLCEDGPASCELCKMSLCVVHIVYVYVFVCVCVCVLPYDEEEPVLRRVPGAV